MNDQINLVSVLSMMVKRWWVLVLCTVVMGVTFFTVTEVFIPEQYTSVGKLLVRHTINYQNEDGTIPAESINTLNTAARLLNTYTEIFSTNTFYNKIAVDSGTAYSANQLKGMVTYTSLNETEVLQVEVKCTDKIEARQLCELILDNAQSEVERIGSGGSVIVVDDATTPTTPTSPNKTLNTVLGILLGAVLGAVIIFIIELLDTRVKTEDDLVSKFDLPILGVIPDLESAMTRGGK